MGIILHDNVYYSMELEVLWNELTHIYGKGVNFNDDIFNGMLIQNLILKQGIYCLNWTHHIVL